MVAGSAQDWTGFLFGEAVPHPHRCMANRRGRGCDNELKPAFPGPRTSAKEITLIFQCLSKLPSALMLMLSRAGGETNQHCSNQSGFPWHMMS